MLPDGSNPEGVDPVPALGWSSKDDFKDVIVHGSAGSWPTCKILSLLIYCDIPFTLTGKPKKTSDYKKMPVLDVAGRQVNDSGIIMKYLVPALGLDSDEYQEWNRKISFCLDPTIRRHLSPQDAARVASTFLGIPSCCGCCVGGLISRMINGAGEKMRALDKGFTFGDEIEIAKEFKTHMGKNDYFAGQEIGAVDISFYGEIAGLIYAKCEMSDNMIDVAGLQDWLIRMQKAIPPSKLFEKQPKGEDRRPSARE